MRARLKLTTICTTAGLLAAATVAVAAPAQASSGSLSGGVLTISFSQPDSVRVYERWDAPGTYLVVSDTGSITSLPGCSGTPADTFECTGVHRVVMTGSGGDDTLNVSGPVAAQLRGGAGADLLQVTEVTAATMHGEGGDDELYAEMAAGAGSGATMDGGDGQDMVVGSAHDDVISGGAGDDHLAGDEGDDTISGGPGHDWLLGDEGDDLLDGGDGNDRFTGGDGADTYRGGPGADQADYFNQYQDQPGTPVNASLDGLANDGAPGEGDNINADGSVENIDTGIYVALGAVTIVGDDGPNHLKGYSPTKMTADGRGGDDLIDVSSMQTGGVTTVHGGAGDDSITTSGERSTVDGGAGDDTIFSGRGHDTVKGGPGTDTLDTGHGNDTINTRDGEVDSISCGVGADTLVGDKIDVVNADPLALCESQELKGGTDPGKPGGGAGPGDGAKGTLKVKLPRRVKVSKKGVVKVRIVNASGDRVRLAVVAKSKKPKLTLGKGKVTIRAGAKKVVKLKLTKKARKQLQRRKKLKATVQVRTLKGTTGRSTKKTVLVR